jgi:hypothetical protein
MTLDLTHLQLVFNVVAITGLSSMTVICTILKRDKEELTAELKVWRDQGWHGPQPRASHPASQASAPEGSTIQAPTPDPDIRQYVRQRMQEWVEVQSACTNT